MTRLLDWPPFIEIEVSQLVAERYQRPLDEKRLNKMVKEFDLKLLGALVTADAEGRYAIIDGQHRWRVLERIGSETVWVQWHENLAYPERAQMFVDLQRRRKNLTPYERFHGECEAGVEQAIEVRRILHEHGFVLGYMPDGPVNQIRAVVALERQYQRGPEVLHKTLQFISEFPKVAKSRTSNDIIRGAGRFFGNHKNISPEDLYERVQLADMTASRMLEEAAKLNKIGGSGRPEAVMKILEELYDF